MKSNVRRGCIGLVLLCSCGCNQSARPPVAPQSLSTSQPRSPSSVATNQQSPQLLGAELTDVILHADSATAAVIDYVGGNLERDEFPRRQVGSVMSVDHALQQALSAALVDPATYDLGTRIMCFQPGVRYEFCKGNRIAAVEICFNCTMLRAGIVDGHGKTGGELYCFIPGYNRLLAVTRQIFPRDKDVQAVANRR